MITWTPTPTTTPAMRSNTASIGLLGSFEAFTRRLHIRRSKGRRLRLSMTYTEDLYLAVMALAVILLAIQSHFSIR
jgi:hypothetical protein